MFYKHNLFPFFLWIFFLTNWKIVFFFFLRLFVKKLHINLCCLGKILSIILHKLMNNILFVLKYREKGFKCFYSLSVCCYYMVFLRKGLFVMFVLWCRVRGIIYPFFVLFMYDFVNLVMVLFVIFFNSLRFCFLIFPGNQKTQNFVLCK